MEKNLDYVSITYTQNLKKTYKKEKKKNRCTFIITFYGLQCRRVHEVIKNPFHSVTRDFVHVEMSI